MKHFKGYALKKRQICSHRPYGCAEGKNSVEPVGQVIALQVQSHIRQFSLSPHVRMLVAWLMLLVSASLSASLVMIVKILLYFLFVPKFPESASHA